MPNITITETLELSDGAVTITRTQGADVDAQLTVATGGADLSVQLTSDEVQVLIECLRKAIARPGGALREAKLSPIEARALRTGPGECGDERADHGEALAPARCTEQPGHDGNHRGGMYNWPRTGQPRPAEATDPFARCSAFHTDDDGADWRCQLPVDHLGAHAVKFGPSWYGSAADEVPMGGRCGNVRYWRPVNASKLDDDMRSVCTLPAGHKAMPHEGPDQTGKVWTWNGGAECNATNGGRWCTLTCGHTGSHEQDGITWSNRLQVD